MISAKKILPVYPEIPKNTNWSFEHALPFIGKKCAMPPLSLITVAALFPHYCRLRLLDMNVEPLKEKDIRILVRSLLKQTFMPYGFQYWKFMIRNIWKHPSKISELVRMAIQGHHFHAITQGLVNIERKSSGGFFLTDVKHHAGKNRYSFSG